MAPTVLTTPAQPFTGDRVIAVLDLIKSMRWPALIVGIFTLFLGPIQGLVQTATSSAFGAHDIVVLGSQTFKVAPTALPHPSDEVTAMLRAMDADVLRTFLDIDRNAIYCGSLEAEYRAGIRRLAHLGLMEARSDFARSPDCRDYAIMTEAGRHVQTFTISLVVAMIKG